MNWEFVNYHCEKRIGFITLNRPKKRNALNKGLINDLKSAFQYADNDRDCKIIILQAEGKSFCAGADLAYLKELQSNSYSKNLKDSKNLMKLFQQIYNSPKLIISKVQGDAIAGGCGLITVCDLIIAADSSRFGYTEVNIGFVPAIVSQFLINRIGVSKSKELLLTGKILSAQEAKEIGLINHSIKKDNLENYVITLATQLIQETSETSIALTKKLTNKLSQKDLEWAAEINAKSRENNDFKKGIESFLNKDKISW